MAKATYKGQEVIEIFEFIADPDDPCTGQFVTIKLADGSSQIVSTEDVNLKIERSHEENGK